MKTKRNLKGFTRAYLSIPYGVFMSVFIIFPLLILLVYAFTPKTGYGDVDWSFTIENFKTIFNGTNLSMLGRSLLIGGITTMICLLIGYPIAYFLAKKNYKNANVLVLLFMLPMWINFLLRTLATKALLQFFSMDMGMATVILGMVYNYLPFMIMPIYTTIQKIDNSLIEGAYDLGATPTKSFWKIIVPLSMPGVLSGITMVFTPTITTFAISGMLSNNTISLIGDFIDTQINNLNYNVASAMSFIIILIVGVSMVLVNKYDKDNASQGGGLW